VVGEQREDGAHGGSRSGRGKQRAARTSNSGITAAELAGRRRWAGSARASNSAIQAEQDLARIER